MSDYGQAAASWNQYAQDNGLTAEQTQAGLDKLAKGDMPEGANIAKVIVDGYKDGVLIAGAAYLGPAASVGKAVGGAVIAEIANGTYQWFDLSKPGNEDKSWDYWSSGAAAVMGGVGADRKIWTNVGIAIGGSLFTDGPYTKGQIGSGLGALLGGGVGEVAPVILNPVLGPSSGFVGAVGGSFISEIISNGVKSYDKDTKDDKK